MAVIRLVLMKQLKLARTYIDQSLVLNLFTLIVLSTLIHITIAIYITYSTLIPDLVPVQSYMEHSLVDWEDVSINLMTIHL